MTARLPRGLLIYPHSQANSRLLDGRSPGLQGLG